MKVKNIREVNTTALAYMGDAVYEQSVREHILLRGYYNVNKLHYIATNYVKAAAQAAIIKELFLELTGQEQALVKRARNRKYTTKAKNADPVTYKWATAFEAFVGYLYLMEDDERLQWVIKRSFEIVEKKNVKQTKEEKEGKE